ncbi:thioredoxin [Breznakibacter xylanolyticus]|uniref:Thioredoxin n=1 Tax=Breznakibacter xylanolyticus TaxID=990 RepID=A0A2W7NYU8_9BACT|nr:thioredoxin [Breznakibacter xylanolyticus]MBN2744082.1 thioredoxin [Marinilabiliaceae bacterium]PZX16372.1 thioredoxin [Breznakibacter xylanolyticus]
MKGNFQNIINDTRPVVVDFFATWCGPCKAQAPILNELASEMGEQVRIIKIDVDQNPDLASRYRVQGVPTLMVFQSGQVRYQQSGVHSKPQLKGVLQRVMAS